MKTTQIVLASRPKGSPTKDDFRFEEKELSPLKEGEVWLKPKFVSVDPYMRGRMNDAESYVPPYQLNSVIDGGVVARVESSKSDKFKEGDYVLGTLPWAKDIFIEASHIRKVDQTIVPPEYYLGILGMPGLTAYFGLLDIGKPQSGETVVVSGAAGAVGSIVGQIAKLKGCRVIGIAGSDDKIKWMKDHLGYDEGINYKTTKDLNLAISEHCPSGVDIYFDNVGGTITDAVINHINYKARIIICGQISLYNETSIQMGPRFLPTILTKSALIKGFIISDYSNRFSEAFPQLGQWVKEDKLLFEETIIRGFENIPEAFLGLFSGKNIGKMLVECY